MIGYMPDETEMTCVECPENTNKLTISNTDCLCGKGYTGTIQESCNECVQGKYKDVYGSSECTTCPEFSNTQGSSATVLTDCQCMHGYTGLHGGPCVPCTPGKIKLSMGAAHA